MTDEAHRIFRKYHHEDTGDHPEFRMFRQVPKTGVIYATSRARAYGFTSADETWANMGQGAPETGPIPEGPPRAESVKLHPVNEEYAPTAGTSELRAKVANYYNELYRSGQDSQYGPENVCVVPGGRAGLARAMAVLGETSVGYFRPDYTAYEQTLSLFMRCRPTPLLHRDPAEAIMPPKEFEFQCKGLGLGAVLMSNPCNPTGQILEGDDLHEYVKISRRNCMLLIMDEFYSHYMYPEDDEEVLGGHPKTVSSARYVEDVNRDPVLIINGLTKNWRNPGWRVCWLVGPRRVVDLLTSAGSFMDGGSNHPLQELALPMLDMDFVRADAVALQKKFRAKRDFLLDNLARLGIAVRWRPVSTFYVWADLSALPPPLNDGLVFFEECIKEKMICVPGVFFDINPASLRDVRDTPCISFVRFSYGPPMINLELGVKSIERVIAKFSKGLKVEPAPPAQGLKRRRSCTYFPNAVSRPAAA